MISCGETYELNNCRLRIEMVIYYSKHSFVTERENSHFDLKSWVTCGNKIRPGISRNWRTFESSWLSITSQYDSNILQLLVIAGRILFPQVTQLFRSKWLHFFFQWTCFHLLCLIWWNTMLFCMRMRRVILLA